MPKLTGHDLGASAGRGPSFGDPHQRFENERRDHTERAENGWYLRHQSLHTDGNRSTNLRSASLPRNVYLTVFPGGKCLIPHSLDELAEVSRTCRKSKNVELTNTCGLIALLSPIHPELRPDAIDA